MYEVCKPAEGAYEGGERITFVHKTEFIERVAEEAGGSKSEAQRYFEAVENVIISALKHDEEVQITGFGKFYAREGAAREGVNPQNPVETVHIPARKIPAFSAGSILKGSI